MNIKKILATVLTMSTVLGICQSVSAETKPVDLKKSVNDGLWNVNRSLVETMIKEKQGENFLVSPYSIYESLAILREGSKEGTRSELSNYLYVPKDADISDILKEKNEKLKEDNLIIANGFFYSDKLKVNDKYMDLIDKKYDTKMEMVDFLSEASAKEKINKWTEEKSKGFLKGDTSVDKDTLAAIINVVYFKGEWEDEYKESSKINFIKRDTHAADVDGIGKTFKTKYIDGFNFKAYAETVEGTNVWFILPNEGVVPENITDFSDYIEKNKIESKKVSVRMPEVNIDQTKVSLKKYLENVGITTVFTNEANLKGISDAIKVADIFHTTKLELDKKGITAAAKTEINMIAKAAPMEKEEEIIELQFNRPYIIIIEKNGDPLFTAVVENPEK